jgi:pimeloyl-ACP methyl ester carboxylesterase
MNDGNSSGFIRLLKEHSLVNMGMFHPPNPPTYTADSFDGQLAMIDGVVAMVLRNEAPFGGKGLLVYTHANATDLGSLYRAMDLARKKLKMHVIAMEYPGYGQSPGHPTERSVNEAFGRLMRAITCEFNVPHERIILMGRSLGSGPAVKYASECPNLGGLVLISPFTSIKDAVKSLAGPIGHLVIDCWRRFLTDIMLAVVLCDVS